MAKHKEHFAVGFGSLCIWSILVGLSIGAYVTVSEQISFVNIDNKSYAPNKVASRQNTQAGIYMDESGVQK